MTRATSIIPSQPPATLAPKTASGDKIRAHRIAPERMPRNRLYRLRKTHRCNYDHAGAYILGNTIGNAVAGGISSSQDTSAQGQQAPQAGGITALQDPGPIQPATIDTSALENLNIQLVPPMDAGAGGGADGEGDYAPPANATHRGVIVGDAVSNPDAPFTPVGQTLDMATLQTRMYAYNQWIAANDPGMTKYDYSQVVAGFGANYQAIVQNDAAVAPDQRQVSLVAGIGLAVMMTPAALAGLDFLGMVGAGSATDGGPLSSASYAQKTFSQTFSADGAFAGRTVSDVAESLASGELSPADVTVQYIVREGNTLILNTRSAQALEQAGIARSEWTAIDMTGDAAAESRLTGQLQRNGLTSQGTPTVRPSGGKGS